MKIGKLIQELEQVKEEHGNLETDVKDVVQGAEPNSLVLRKSKIGTPSKNNLEFL